MNNVIEAPFIKPQVRPVGPPDADVLIVGEAPGQNEVNAGVPFVGTSGKELDRMLHEAGILRTDCRITNVCPVKPPGNKIEKFYLKNTAKERIPGPQIQQGIKALHEEILSTKPKVIIALGDTALWALTSERGIVKWRGSHLRYTHPEEEFSCDLLPTYHPAAILRQWSWRFIGVMDLRRAAGWLREAPKYPEREYLLRPSFSTAMQHLTFMEFIANGSELISRELARQDNSDGRWLLELPWGDVEWLPGYLVQSEALEGASARVSPIPGKSRAWEISLPLVRQPELYEPEPSLSGNFPREHERPTTSGQSLSVLEPKVRDCSIRVSVRKNPTTNRESLWCESHNGFRLCAGLPLSQGLRAACDIETRGGHTACIGFATYENYAFCLPLMCTERHEGYWTQEEELALVLKLREVFIHPRILWIFQNGLYDLQYIARFWGVVPRNVWMDTMLAHHVCFAGLQKSLDFLSSMYLEYHRYWKDDGRNWDLKTGEDQLWRYNCDDCVATWEIADNLDIQLDRMNLREQFEFQMRQFNAVFFMMVRGVRCDLSHKNELISQLDAAKAELMTWILTAVGGDEWGYNEKMLGSYKQMQRLFYDELNIKPIRNRKTGRITTDDGALDTILKRQPVLRPLITRIRAARSVGVFLSTFARMPLDRDGRIRCSYNVAGTETYRYSSSQNAFGSGTNLQNIPAGDEDDPTGDYPLPNIKKIFKPDVGYELADADLDRADAQVVAAEANDEILRQMFREGADIHLENAKAIFSNERLTKDSRERQLAKAGVHATNYGASPGTLARTLGITVREAERFQNQWFGAHPGIADWHRRTEDALSTSRKVVNRFGFERYYFDRIEGVLPEALAWVPQSTVALVISHGLVNIHENHPEIHCLLQVHDSLVFQYPKHLRNPSLRKAREAMEVEIPYDDPLTIPVGFKISEVSYGDTYDYEPPEVSTISIQN